MLFRPFGNIVAYSDFSGDTPMLIVSCMVFNDSMDHSKGGIKYVTRIYAPEKMLKHIDNIESASVAMIDCVLKEISQCKWYSHLDEEDVEIFISAAVGAIDEVARSTWRKYHKRCG